MISKTSYIGYDMKSLKMILWSIWYHLPLIFEDINLRNAMKSLANIVEISEKEFLMISYTHKY